MFLIRVTDPWSLVDLLTMKGLHFHCLLFSLTIIFQVQILMHAEFAGKLTNTTIIGIITKSSTVVVNRHLDASIVHNNIEASGI